MADEDKPQADAEEVEEVFEPSELDEATHAEMAVLYRESTDTVRYVKHLQWWTVGSTLAAYLGLVGIAKIVTADKLFTAQLTGAMILVTMAVIFTLVVYQFWQHTELNKIEEISKTFSTAFTRIRRLKSRREANIHRYLLLIFMILTILLGAIITYLALQQLIDHRYR